MIDHIFHDLFPAKGMAERPEQVELSHLMLDAMLDGTIALCDAGTGIGKTYSYLAAGAAFLRLRAASGESFKKIASLSFGRRATPGQKTQVVQELRRKYPLSLLLSIAQLPRATFYYHLKRQGKPDKHKELKQKIKAIFEENRGRYGYRQITLALRNAGIICNHKLVYRLMKEQGLICKVRMKKYNSYKGEVGKIAPNLLERNFEAAAPNQKMVTDVTEFHLFGQKLYLSIMLDLYSRHRQLFHFTQPKPFAGSFYAGGCISNHSRWGKSYFAFRPRLAIPA